MNAILKFVSAIIILLTTVAAASADLYISTGGSGWLGDYGTVRATGRGYDAGGMVTPSGGVYAGANTRHGAASFGYHNGQLTGLSVRTANTRANTFRTTDGYAGTVGIGSRIHTPSYYHQGVYYGGTYAPIANVRSYTQPANSRYVSTTSYMHSRY